MSYITLVGSFAGVCTSVAFFPQVWKALKTHSTKDISLLAFSIQAVGNFLWLLYGILLGELPIVLSNGITFIFASVILVIKIKYH